MDLTQYNISDNKKTDISKENKFYNKTTEFVLPSLGKKISFYSKYLYNAYFHPEFDDVICVVMTDNIPLEVDDEMSSISGFLDSVKHLNYIVYQYNLPNEFHKDIRLFKLGKYSKMSNSYKERVLMYNMPDTISFDLSKCLLYGILYKKEFMREHWENKLNSDIPKDAELWSIPDMDEETLYIDELKINL